MTIPTLPLAGAAQMSEFPTWRDVEKLVDYLLPQLRGPYDALLLITRGGIVPGGLIAEALNLRYILTAAVEFPAGGSQSRTYGGLSRSGPETVQARLAWPTFLQFPNDALLRGKHILIVDNIWANGRTITTVKGRVLAAGGTSEVAVLHYKPGSNLFREAGPDHYAAVTDRFVIYPWEIERGPDRLESRVPQTN